MDLPNRDDLLTVARRYVRAAPQSRVNPALVDVPGSDLNLFLGAVSVVGEALTASWAACARALLVDTARGDELDRIAFDRFGLTRKPAAPAGVTLVFSRPAAVGSGVVPAGTRVQTAAGTRFATTVDLAFGPTQLSGSVDAVAQVVGPEANAPAGAVAQLADALFDATLSVTNPAGAAGGADPETDAAFRGRIRGFFLTVRRGTRQAVQYGATQVAGVQVATAFEVTNPGTGLPAAAGELVVGDASGHAAGPMIQAVIDEMLSWRPIGTPVFVSGGRVVFVPVSYKLTFDPNVDTVAAAADVRSVAVAVAQFLRPGQTLSRFTLNQAPGAVPGVVVRDSTLVAPAGDVEPEDNTVILRVRPEDVSFV